MSNIPTSSISLNQIRRRANDYDSQIRQGLEDGNVRQVVKRLGADLVELFTLRTRGTAEQVEAFPRPLFLYQFVRAWNKSQSDPKFVDQQLEALEQFDAQHLAGSVGIPIPTPIPTDTTPAPPEPSKKSTPPPRARPSRPAPVRVAKRPLPSPSPPPPPPPRTAAAAAAVDGPSRLPDRRIPTHSRPGSQRQVMVVVPHHSSRKFREIEASEDEEEYRPSPSPIPPTRTKPTQSTPPIQKVWIFTTRCYRCKRGDRDCEVDVMGKACAGCKAHKYGCEKTGKLDEETARVIRSVSESGSEVEFVEEGKGKKRQASSPGPSKRKTKKVKVEKEAKPRAKGKARQRAPPKSAPVVHTDEGGMGVDEDTVVVNPPKTKRARIIKESDYNERIAALEEQMKGFQKVAEETTRTSRRVDAIEGTVNRFAGSLEGFLSRIQIDDRLRLVPDTRRIEGSHSPCPPSRLSPSPFTPLEVPMDLDEADSDAPTLPLPSPVVDPAPSVNLIPATPQASQEGPVPLPRPPSPPLPPVSEVESLPPPSRHLRSRSRSQAAAFLGAEEGRNTRSRSRSKTPI